MGLDTHTHTHIHHIGIGHYDESMKYEVTILDGRCRSYSMAFYDTHTHTYIHTF